MGTIDTLCVSLIVAMSMKHTFVTQDFFSTLAFRRDVINLHDVAILKEQVTPTTFSALLLKEFSERSIDHGVPFQSSTPIEEISIIRTCRSFDFDMTLYLGAIMFPQERSLIAEDPSFPFCHMPVFVRDPKHTFVWVTASGPTLEVLKVSVATMLR